MKIRDRYTGDVILEVGRLSGADLSGANLSGADLFGANLFGANFSGADLSMADLSRADLSRADLSRANLSGTNLSWTNLFGANLIVGGQRSDGYRFLLYKTQEGPMLSAGCRYFSLELARSHWTSTRGGTKLGAESLALVSHLEAMAKIAGWIEE